MSVKELSYCVDHNLLIDNALKSCDHNTCRLLGMDHMRKKVEKTAENRTKKLDEFFEKDLSKEVDEFKKFWMSKVKNPVVKELDSLEELIVSKIKSRFSWNVEEQQDFPTLNSNDFSTNDSVYDALSELLRNNASRVVPIESIGGSQSVYGEETLENLAEKVNFDLKFNGLNEKTIEKAKKEIKEIKKLLIGDEGLKAVLLGSLKKLKATVSKWDNDVEIQDINDKFYLNKKDLNITVATPALPHPEKDPEKSVFLNDEGMQDDAPNADSDENDSEESNSEKSNSALNSKLCTYSQAAIAEKPKTTPEKIINNPPESESNSVSVSASASVSVSVSELSLSQRQLVRLLELVANDFSGPEIPPKTPKEGVKKYFERFLEKLQDIQKEILRKLES